MPQYEVTHLRAGYAEDRLFGSSRRRTVIEGLSFTIRGGEVLAIVGGNGSGKSTLLRAIVDPRARDGGDVRCEGRPINSSEIAYVPQSAVLTLSPWATVASEMTLPLRIRGVAPAVRKRLLLERIAELKLDLPLERRVERLSGGQRVRVAWGRALMVSTPQLVVLDEPFEGLDEATRRILFDLVIRIADSGAAVIATSHRAEDLVSLGAKVVELVGTPVRDLRVLAPAARAAAPAASSSSTTTLPELELRSNEPDARVRRARSMAMGLGGMLAGLLVWWAMALLVRNPGVLPGPLSVGVAMVDIAFSAEIGHLVATVSRALVAWLVAAAFAIPLGIVLGAYTGAYRLLAPWLSLGRCIPVFALAGSAIGLLPGFPESQRMVLITLTLFLIGIQIVATAAAVAPRRRMDFARVLGATRAFQIWRVLARECAAGIASALEVTLPTSVIVTLVVETTLLPTSGGLGLYLFNHLTDRDLSRVFAYVLLAGLIAAGGVWVIRSWSGTLRREI